MSKLKILKSNTLYFSGLLLLVTGLPVSLFLTSFSQFVILAAFLFEGNIKEKFSRFFSNKAALLFSGIWLLHLIGLLWTMDLNDGLKDLRIKLPILVLPLIIAGNKPLSSNQFRWLLLTFVFSVFCGTMVSMAVLSGIIYRNIYDIRDIFIFNISHIRFALFTCLSIYILIWLAFREKKTIISTQKFLAVLLIIWFLVFLIIVESVTGVLIFSITGLVLLLYHGFTSGELKFRIILTTTILLLPLTFIFVLEKFVSDFYINHPYPINITEKTKLGNDYNFNLKDPHYENGYPVWVYVCDEELRSSWNKISTIKYDSTDERKQPLKYTLIRFLSSKGLRKDAEGLSKLNIKEIHSIERGIANVNYQEISSMRARLLQIMWEFDLFIKGGDPNGHSVTQRFEFWKAAMGIASSNLLIGVGTGDMPTAYRQQYIKMNTALDSQHQLRSHNQYLAIMVAFGITGLVYFLLAFFYPLFVYRRKIGFLFAAFFLISIISMISEDTLETQAGATFVAFFFSLLLFGKPETAKKAI